MLGQKTVLVVGTGTIGEPLIGLLCHFRDQLGIDDVVFHKRTPLMTDRSKVLDLIRRGARLATDADRVAEFEKTGAKVSLTTDEALEGARVVIDCTPSVRIVHQNHDYRHLPGAKPHYEHPETNENIRLAGGPAVVRYTILDATHRLVDGKLVRPAFTSLRLWRRVELFLRKVFFFLPDNLIENIARPKRWKKRIQKLFKP